MFMDCFLLVMKVMVTAVQTPSPQTRSQSQDKGRWLSCDLILFMLFIVGVYVVFLLLSDRNCGLCILDLSGSRYMLYLIHFLSFMAHTLLFLHL